MSRKSNLDLVNECDSFPYFDVEGSQDTGSTAGYYKFKVDGTSPVLGLIPNEIAKRFPLTDDWQLDDQHRSLIFRPRATPLSDPKAAETHRSKVLAEYLAEVRQKKVFKILDGWRDELYPVYGPNRQLILSMERAASALFGVVTYGIHMTAYVNSPEGMKIWLPRRSPTKQTYPGMMDNTVAGGLSSGEHPFGCLLRESMEEASLAEDVVKNAICCGTLTYHYIRDANAGGEVGLSQPECQFIYDLELPDSVIPQPNDQEAVDFRALTVDEVKEALADGKFKPNCSLLMLEFFVRHGIINPENEPDYIEIVSRFHRRLASPTM